MAGAETAQAAMAPGWRSVPLGPWQRYRRDLGGGRRAIVSPGPCGGWVWDLWSVLDYPVYLEPGQAATARQAMDDADRDAAAHAALTDAELIDRNGVDAGAEAVALAIVTVGGGARCVVCDNQIAAGLAAEQTGGGRYLWCPSCACRNPGAALA